MKLQGANLERAQLQGVDASGAQLQGANLERAQLQGADLRGAALWQAHFNEYSDFSLADLRKTQLHPISPEGLTEILWPLRTIPERQHQRTVDRVTEALTPVAAARHPATARITPGEPALVGMNPPAFVVLSTGLTTDEAFYDMALAPFLADLARNDPDVAGAIAQRLLSSQQGGPEAKRRLWPDLAQRLLAAEKEGAIKLDLPPDDRKTLEDLAAKAPPSPPRKPRKKTR